MCLLTLCLEQPTFRPGEENVFEQVFSLLQAEDTSVLKPAVRSRSLALQV